MFDYNQLLLITPLLTNFYLNSIRVGCITCLKKRKIVLCRNLVTVCYVRQSKPHRNVLLPLMLDIFQAKSTF